MPDFDISIDIYLLASLLALAMLSGFLLRSQQLAKKKRKIMALERDIIEANAEVLETQRDYCELESKVRDEGENSPVIPLKKASETGTGKNF